MKTRLECDKLIQNNYSQGRLEVIQPLKSDECFALPKKKHIKNYVNNLPPEYKERARISFKGLHREYKQLLIEFNSKVKRYVADYSLPYQNVHPDDEAEIMALGNRGIQIGLIYPISVILAANFIKSDHSTDMFQQTESKDLYSTEASSIQSRSMELRTTQIPNYSPNLDWFKFILEQQPHIVRLGIYKKFRLCNSSINELREATDAANVTDADFHEEFINHILQNRYSLNRFDSLDLCKIYVPLNVSSASFDEALTLFRIARIALTLLNGGLDPAFYVETNDVNRVNEPYYIQKHSQLVEHFTSLQSNAIEALGRHGSLNSGELSTLPIELIKELLGLD